MSGFVKEFSATSGATNVTSVQVSIPSAIPVGNALVAAVVTLNSTVPIAGVAATDTKGNTWTFLHTDIIGATTAGTHLLYVNVTHALTTADTITFTYSDVATRSAISVVEFNDILAPDVRADGDNGGNSSNVLATDATTATSEANELIFGTFGLVNPGRIFTATNGFTTLTKVVSSGASGNRAICPEYKYVSVVGDQTANGTLDSSAVWSGIVQTFTLGALPPSRSGRPKVWDGIAWVARDAKTWNGTAWVTHKAKGYDGSTWVESK